MFILINGTFGIGKSSVARELRALLPGSVIYDPEPVGVLLQRFRRQRVSDFQHLPSWRRLTVAAGRSAAVFRVPVIIPMAFSELAYLEDVRSGLAVSGRPVLHFCLTGSLDVVRGRLRRRGHPPEEARWAWMHRLAAECCVAHQSESFATLVPTESRPAAAVAADLADRVRGARTAC